MITKSNLKELLKSLNFKESGEIYSKKFENFDCLLKVDFKKGKIIYPEKKGLKVNRKDTTHLKSNENFVVLECVNRLLEKGYNPKHIELEHSFDSGHGLNYGRADVLVRNNANKTILFIECKTAGSEYTKAWKTTLEDGGQIFSYASKEASKPFICLYASDYIDGKTKADYHLITLKDNEQYLEDNPKLIGYKDAFKKDELFNVWKNTYQQDYTTKGLFEEDIQAYNIGKEKYTVEDLSLVDSSTKQSKYHEFATILRKYNVSGRENAFDKLINLFLCKIVDEKNNPKDLQFYWKGIAYDTPFELQDRLQKLYKVGMGEFLKEEVTYIDNKQIDKAFWTFKNDPDATKETIKGYFKQLKFFTNNDFAFIDVHNERLFYENAEVLIDIVRLFQDTKIKSNSKNQFLGDMFENFLDSGVKQSEGQFFTPMPITRFIMQSLPLESIIKESQQPPKAIDYACGSGHFLNELASQIRPFVEANKDAQLENYHKEIYGIEKEYRLSKVAKVSAFMYGQENIDLTYSDALAKNDKFKNDSFKILVANPPYSVKGFLSTLDQDSKNTYNLINTIDSKAIQTNNSIECFFIERAKQLLDAGGVSAIIVPTSILSNTDATYQGTRSILLKYFSIVAIAEFGSGTFGKTGTNTVILFLKRRNENPEIAQHYQNRVDSWFANDTKKQKVFEDEHYIKQYCSQLEYDFDDYKTLLKGEPNKTLLEMEMFENYKAAFDKLSSITAKKKQSNFKKLKKEKQEKELTELFNKYLFEIEKEKLYYFTLASNNQNEVVIVKAPSDNKASKKFLGYEWSSAKGNEGIKLHTDEKNNHITPLYDETNRNNIEKVNFYIQQAFENKKPEIIEDLKPFVNRSSLVNMLDFKRTDFDRQISLTPKKVVHIETQWDLKKLGEICEVKIGGTPSRDNQTYFTGKNLWVSISEMKGQIIIDTKEKLTNDAIKNSNVKLIPKGTTLLSFKLSIGKTAVAGKNLYTNEAIAGLIPKNENLKDEYLLHLFNSKLIDLENVGNKAFGKSLNSTYLKNEVKIPLPSLDIQEDIIKECEAIDKDVEEVNKNIEGLRTKIENETKSIGSDFISVALSEISKSISSGLTPLRSNSQFWQNGSIPWLKTEQLNEKNIYDTNEKISEIAFKTTTIKLNKKNTLSIAMYGEGKTRGSVAILKKEMTTNQACCNVYLDAEKADYEYVYYFLKTQYHNLRELSSGVRHNLNTSHIKNYKINLPSLKTQKDIVEKILKIEEEISKSRTIISNSSYKKQTILRKYL